MIVAKALVDTNFLLDLVTGDRPGSHAAARMIDAVQEGRAELSVCATSLKDFYYIARKGGFTDRERRECIRFFLEAMDVLPLDRKACATAVDSDEPDFEDGAIRAVAESSGCDWIVTRDAAAFANSTARNVAPDAFLASAIGRE